MYDAWGRWKTTKRKITCLTSIFYAFVLSCVCYVLCASVYMCFVVTCWERADLLALVCDVFCEFVTFPLVSWVRCGTWLYRFLIFAPLLTFLSITYNGCDFCLLTPSAFLAFPKCLFKGWRLKFRSFICLRSCSRHCNWNWSALHKDAHEKDAKHKKLLNLLCIVYLFSFVWRSTCSWE